MLGIATAALAALLTPGLIAQDEDFHVYGEAPRLLLGKQRLRLLQRERERNRANVPYQTKYLGLNREYQTP